MRRATRQQGPDDAEQAGTDAIVSRLDILISMLLPPAKNYADQVSRLQYDILALCDYDHTTEEICKSTNKSPNHVNKELSVLRSKGLVKTVKRDERSVHVRL